MRIIRVDEDESSTHTALWVAAGVVAGLLTGVLVAERMSGRRMSARGIWRRTRDLAGRAVERWEPLLDAAIQVRDAWSAPQDEVDEDLDEELEEEEEAELDIEGAAEEDVDEDEEESADEEDTEAASDPNAIDERVLVAFTNDPILADRDIEIEATDEGGILLHGRVRTSEEVARAVTIARGVPGVAGVRQRLRVRDRR